MTSIMLFGMFFGAGNLIFPPMVGKMAGKNVWFTMVFFCITAVILPIMGVIAVAKANGLKNLAHRVGNRFSEIFTACVYLSIGPALAIPRAGSVPFEMVIRPYLPEAFSGHLALFLYTLVFFGLAFWLVLTPNKLVERIGRFITPTLLILLGLMFLVALVKGMPPIGQALGENYQANAGFSGFIDGYSTMDTLAALNFGLIISMVIQDFNINQEKDIIATTIKAGLAAGSILAVIYFALAYLGASTAGLFPETTNGAQILSQVSGYLLGRGGAIFIGTVFTIACLTVSVGLITSSGKYFASLGQKVTYKHWVIIWTLLSFVFSNIGLDAIIKYNLVVLFVLYPIAIVLIILALCDRWVEADPWMYRSGVYVAAIISGVRALEMKGGLEIKVPLVQPLFSRLPLYKVDLGWLVPVLVVLLITYILKQMGITGPRTGK